MYRLFNYLFGWDYIYWENSADEGISRIRKTPDGTLWYYRYKITTTIDEVGDNNEIWLTCKKSKYINPQKNK